MSDLGQSEPIVALTPRDAQAMANLESLCHHPDLLEGVPCFVSFTKQWPGCALGMHNNGALIAYALAHPVTSGHIPPLGTPQARPDKPWDWFIHDVVVHPDHRGKGLATIMLENSLALDIAQTCTKAALVAIEGRAGYWTRLGFVASSKPVLLELGYGKASYMVRQLPPRQPPSTEPPANSKK